MTRRLAIALVCLISLLVCTAASSGPRLIAGGDAGWEGWTVEGDCWTNAVRDPGATHHGGNPFPTKPDWESGEMSTGTLRSPSFKLTSDVIRLTVNGWDTRPGGAGKAGFSLRLASDGKVLRTAEPPLSDTFALRSWSVTEFIGQDVYIEAFDRISEGGFAWVGLAAVEAIDLDVPASESVYRAIPFSTGLGIWSICDFDGASNKVNPYLSSLRMGEGAIGRVKSPEFEIKAPKIRLLVRGHDTKQEPAGQNVIQLISADTGDVLRVAKPPQDDRPHWTEWDASDLQGRKVYLRLVDQNGSTSYAWFGLDEIDAGPDFHVKFADNGSIKGWTAEQSTPEQIDRGGIPFLAPQFSAVIDGQTTSIPMGCRAKHIFVLGMTNSMDVGNLCWFDPPNYKIRFFVGDKIGDIRVIYADGKSDTYPLVIGRNIWWGKRFFEFPEPFASDPKAKQALADSLRLFPPRPNVEAAYMAVIAPRPVKIDRIEIADSPEKSGAPVIAGLTVEPEDGEAVPNGLALAHNTLTDEARLFIEKMPLEPAGVGEKQAQTKLAKLRDAFYTTESNFPKHVAVDIPSGYRGPKVKFEGDPYAEVMTNIFYHNLFDIDSKVDSEGMYHTSTKDAPSWGVYEGFGSYVEKFGSYYSQTWTRDMGRSLGELTALGILDKAKWCADHVFLQARVWEEGYKPEFKCVTSGKLDLDGHKLPRHICRVLNMPDTTPGQGCFENDGHGLTGLFVYNLWLRLPDRTEWLRSRWEGVKGLGDWVTWQLENPEISGATETLRTDSECSAGIGHSVYADVAQIESLRGLAEMADSIGEKASASDWRKAADRLTAGCLKEYVIDDKRYGKVWTLTSSGWPNQATVVGPVIFLPDRAGFAPEECDTTWRKVTEASYQRLIDKYKPFGFYGVAMGYGQGFVTQCALLLDRMQDATTMMQWAAKATYCANYKPYIVPEGCEVSEDGKSWRRTGDLGNGVQEGEIVKAIRLVIGIDNTSTNRLAVFPRMPYGWTSITTSEYPIWLGAEQAKLSYTLTRNNTVMTMQISSSADLGEVDFRLGPFAKRPIDSCASVNGKATKRKVEKSGDSWWVRLSAPVGISHTKIDIRQ